jgi:hypothetical protein
MLGVLSLKSLKSSCFVPRSDGSIAVRSRFNDARSMFKGWAITVQLLRVQGLMMRVQRFNAARSKV